MYICIYIYVCIYVYINIYIYIYIYTYIYIIITYALQMITLNRISQHIFSQFDSFIFRTFHIALSFDVDQALRHRDQIGMMRQTLVRTWEKTFYSLKPNGISPHRSNPFQNKRQQVQSSSEQIKTNQNKSQRI